MRVALEDVGFAYPGGRALFRGLTLTVNSGETVAIVGPSGSGKSTLLGIIAGWHSATEGRIDLPVGATIGWVFQQPNGTPQRAALDHVALPYLARGLSRSAAEARALALCDVFGLTSVARRPFSTLSGGEAQRLMLARALAMSADILLLDEPTAQLDPATAASVASLVGRVADGGACVFVATHDPRVRAECTMRLELGGLDRYGGTP